jgi:excisionase family DNA binding protein
MNYEPSHDLCTLKTLKTSGAVDRDFAMAGAAEMDRRISVTLDSIIEMLASAVAAKLRADIGSSGGSAPIAPRLLSVDQAAVYLGRSKDAVQHMVAARKLPVVRDGRRVFLDVQELDRWIERSTEPAEI